MTSTRIGTDAGPGRADGPGTAAAAEVSRPRLHLLRAGYLLIGVGLAVTMWPSFVSDSQSWPLMDGVVACMLAALSILAFVGVRHPLRMIPLLLWECAWKLIWLAVVALPQWASGPMDQAAQGVAFSCLFVVFVLAVLPWRHVAEHYGLRSGQRSRGGVDATS